VRTQPLHDDNIQHDEHQSSTAGCVLLDADSVQDMEGVIVRVRKPEGTLCGNSGFRSERNDPSPSPAARARVAARAMQGPLMVNGGIASPDLRRDLDIVLRQLRRERVRSVPDPVQWPVPPQPLLQVGPRYKPKAPVLDARVIDRKPE
jgi:hypothetical protein